MKHRTYTDPKSGKRWPLEEAEVDYSFPVYKTDKRKAVIGDPTQCLIAKGLQHDKNIVAAFIGGGKDAFVVFKGKGRLGEHAKHYVILAKAARVRDTFDQKGAPATQHLTLSAPTAGRTLDAREKMNKRRREEIKNGAPVKHRAPANVPRMTRVDVERRPKPIVDKGEWSIPDLALSV